MHFIVGKGGVGRSTLAAALTRKLAHESAQPVLLLEIQGNGRSLEACGWDGPKTFEVQPLPAVPRAWGARITPKDAFRQYFQVLLALGSEDSPIGNATGMLREKIASSVMDNKVVSAFIEICPGLEPSVLLGKIHFEASQGGPPDSRSPWSHVVVDAPATGHGLMLFRSTAALTSVFGGGVIFRQANEIMRFMRDPASTKVRVVGLPEDLPLQEGLELCAGLKAMGIEPASFLVNRCSPLVQATGQTPTLSPEWAREAAFEAQNSTEQAMLLEEFRGKLPAHIPLHHVPEAVQESATGLAEELAGSIA